jgi:hypothetical protein
MFWGVRVRELPITINKLLGLTSPRETALVRLYLSPLKRDTSSRQRHQWPCAAGLPCRRSANLRRSGR